MLFSKNVKRDRDYKKKKKSNKSYVNKQFKYIVRYEQIKLSSE